MRSIQIFISIWIVNSKGCPVGFIVSFVIWKYDYLKPVGVAKSTPRDLAGSDCLSDARLNVCFCFRRADCLRGKMCSVTDRPFGDGSLMYTFLF